SDGQCDEDQHDRRRPSTCECTMDDPRRPAMIGREREESAETDRRREALEHPEGETIEDEPTTLRALIEEDEAHHHDGGDRDASADAQDRRPHEIELLLGRERPREREDDGILAAVVEEPVRRVGRVERNIREEVVADGTSVAQYNGMDDEGAEHEVVKGED